MGHDAASIVVSITRAEPIALAEQSLRRALELNPSDDEPMYNLAEVIRVSRRQPASEEAVELYRAGAGN